MNSFNNSRLLVRYSMNSFSGLRLLGLVLDLALVNLFIRLRDIYN